MFVFVILICMGLSVKIKNKEWLYDDVRTSLNQDGHNDNYRDGNGNTRRNTYKCMYWDCPIQSTS